MERKDEAMFETDSIGDKVSSKLTRRVFLAGTAAGLVSLLVLRRFRAPGVEASTTVHGTFGQVTIFSFSNDGKNLGSQRVEKIVKSDGEWYRQLGANSFGIARQADTEMPYSGVSWKEHRAGLYRCLCCNTALFNSNTKFESGTGWPSFWAPVAKENIADKSDSSLGMDRTEVRCARCEAHLGHVFPDGPEPTGLRYCMNSASMQLNLA
jgi:peptide-methionine (R)-S-oxide reductase